MKTEPLTTSERMARRVGRLGFFGAAALTLALATPIPAMAERHDDGYRFKEVARLGDPAPGLPDGDFEGDFEPYAINNRGQVAFAADLSIGAEGVFAGYPGHLGGLAYGGQPAPGGGTFGIGVLGDIGLNERGDLVFDFALDPFGQPLGANTGIYRYSAHSRTVIPVLIPGVTPAPAGGMFQGTLLRNSMNNRGDIVFAGMIPTDKGIHVAGQAYPGLGLGVFLARAGGAISSVASPGDGAPGGDTFDTVGNGYLNDRGDVAFDAHLTGDECIDFGGAQSARLFCAASVYLRRAHGEIVSIAHQGQPAPGGGTYRLAFGPVVNNHRQMVFIGDLTPAPGAGDQLSVFFHNGHTTVPVARPGDPLPGGGNMLRAAFQIGNYSLNQRGDIAFNAALDTATAGIADTGLYVARKSRIQLVARTGTVIPGVGTIAHLRNAFAVTGDTPTSGAVMNDHGQVFFTAVLSDGKAVLLIATPHD